MGRRTLKCPKCGRYITCNNFSRHVKSCSGRTKDTSKVDNLPVTLLPSGKYKCNICGKVYSRNGIYTHYWRSHGEGKLHDPNKNLRGVPNVRKGWNKYNHPEIIEQGKKVSRTLKSLYASGKIKTPKMTTEQLKALSLRMSEHNPGGKSKWYTVNGVKVQGTWEKYFAEKLTLHNIEWSRGPRIAWISGDGKHHTYSPDFYIPSKNLFIEIKGRWWGNDKEKMRCVYSQHKELRGKLWILRSHKVMDLFIDKMSV